jgi:Tfp pilus assembly protein PilF
MLIALVLATAVATPCGPLLALQTGGDYTDPADADKRQVVEQFHFTPEVEALRGGSTGSLGADLGYTLEHFPNHHRALAALMRLSQRLHDLHPPGAHYATECYFERALRFRPRDTQVHRLYADFLLGQNRFSEAQAQLLQVVAAEPADALAHYNLGLLYADQHDFAAARAHARQAYALQFPLPGLRRRLRAAGQWESEP